MSFELYGRKCPICRKEFFPTSQWVYKYGTRWYCSYGCMRKDEKKREMEKEEENKRTRQSRITDAEREKIIEMLKNGIDTNEIIKTIGVTYNAVRYYKRKMVNTT